MDSLKREFLFLAVVVILILFLLIITAEPSAPKDFVKEMTVSNYSNIFFNYKMIRYPTEVEIAPAEEENVNLGFVTDPWNLKFGGVSGNGSYVKRYINVKNSKEEYAKIKLKAYGNIAPLVNFSKSDFVLNENESTAIEVTLYTDSAEYGNYSGEIDVIIKTPRNDLFKALT